MSSPTHTTFSDDGGCMVSVSTSTQPSWQVQAAEACRSLSRDRTHNLVVGKNDVLIVHVRTTDVIPAHMTAFLHKIKSSLAPVWEKVGICDRVLYVAGDEQYFSVIHVRAPKMTQLDKEVIDYAKDTLKWSSGKARSDVPVIG